MNNKGTNFFGRPFQVGVSALVAVALLPMSYLFGHTSASGIGSAAVFGLVAGGTLVTLATCRVRVLLKRSILELVGFLTVTKIPFAAITSITGRNGLKVSAVTGRNYGSIALGSSVIGQIFGDRKAIRIAGRLTSMTLEGTVNDSGAANREIVVGFRWETLALYAISLIVYVSLGILGHLLAK